MIPRPEMIPKLDRKWSPIWTANDPAEKQGMVWILGFKFCLFIYLFIYFYQPKEY